MMNCTISICVNVELDVVASIFNSANYLMHAHVITGIFKWLYH